MRKVKTAPAPPAEKEAMQPPDIEPPDRTFELFRRTLKLMRDLAGSLSKEMDMIEKRLVEAEKRSAGPAQLYVMPDRTDVIQ
jgi:hypothetical protein